MGKTSFVNRYTNDEFRTDYKGTVGVDFALKVVHLTNDIVIKLQLWDIAGQDTIVASYATLARPFGQFQEEARLLSSLSRGFLEFCYRLRRHY